MSNIEIGGRIRELREGQNYTREALAEKVDISAKFLYEIEMGKKGFSADTLCRISQALSVSCDYIMLGEATGYRGKEKIICVLEKLEPKQTSKMKDILSILSEMCEAI
ncbi:MAG: helix-turn-helix domain-containing protein [Lachnoclostridium sp.]|nr:helix-turn-helix domain-containing protein [Lachnospira sp.]MCM1249007.1 helix-turn-helix domain-containing protein [Lachnoclostridium sp.]